LSWRPVVVEIRVGVDKRSDVKYPLVIPPVVDRRLVCRPDVVDTREDVRDNEEIYPEEPSPTTVDRKLLPIAIPATVEATVEVSSLISIKLLT